MHAIIETGGKQFRVAPGDVVRVPKLAAEVGRGNRSRQGSGAVSRMAASYC